MTTSGSYGVYVEVTTEDRKNLIEYMKMREIQLTGPPLKYGYSLYMVKGRNTKTIPRVFTIVTVNFFNSRTKHMFK